ncbi:hypothetical protein FAI40_07415 [Acetobacteraceae bacterium]|nr:hypothetical protein FAI40_07415 [Acetobacteraceae bacterium]
MKKTRQASFYISALATVAFCFSAHHSFAQAAPSEGENTSPAAPAKDAQAQEKTQDAPSPEASQEKQASESTQQPSDSSEKQVAESGNVSQPQQPAPAASSEQPQTPPSASSAVPQASTQDNASQEKAAEAPAATPSTGPKKEIDPRADNSSVAATITKEELEQQAKKIEDSQVPSQNQKDYSLIVFPQLEWKEPEAGKPGWQSYYAQVKFLLKGGMSHRMSDVIPLSIDTFESGKAGNPKDRGMTALQALNSVFNDEGTTGKAHLNQNGLTNILLTPNGSIHVKRSSLCTYNMPVAHFTTTTNMMHLIFLPDVQLPERCGDVPIGMQLDIVSGAHEELLQKLYCDDFPKATYCSPTAEHWTIPEFKQTS